ncbi:hypothetical protein ACQZ4P_28230, partial [Agrobacterium vitis]
MKILMVNVSGGWRGRRRMQPRYDACWHSPLKCTPVLGQRELEFSGVKAQVGVGADEPFISEIGT